MTSGRIITIRHLLARVHLRLILFAVLLAAASLTVSGGLVIRNYVQQNLDLLALGERPKVRQCVWPFVDWFVVDVVDTEISPRLSHW